MIDDQSRMLLFVALTLFVLVVVSNKRRPLASAPLAADTVTDESEIGRSMITSSQFANVPSNDPIPPFALLVPQGGTQEG